MPTFNEQDFFALRQLDLENKLFLPTSKLYSQGRFQLNALYQDIRNALIDIHSVVASASKQVYEHPVETMTGWYEQIGNDGAALFSQAQTIVLPVYQNWQVKWSTVKEEAIQYFQAFWDNPEQTALAALEPVTHYANATSARVDRNVQLFLDNPEQFMISAFEPVMNYLTSLTESSKTVLINTYYALADLFSLLISQPSATLQAVYKHTLSTLLDVYFDVISSFLVIA